jgi:pantetheine-phosphate adenylyltransferase
MSAPVRRLALCPGTYDPITFGHLDIIERAARIFDAVVVSIVQGSDRKHPMFSVEERIDLVRDAVAHIENVSVRSFHMLVTAHAKEQGAVALVKGLRAISDFDYEFQMAQINKDLDADIETVYLPASAKYSFISSSGVREVAVWGGRVDDWVPAHVATALRKRAKRPPAGGTGTGDSHMEA